MPIGTLRYSYFGKLFAQLTICGEYLTLVLAPACQLLDWKHARIAAHTPFVSIANNNT